VVQLAGPGEQGGPVQRPGNPASAVSSSAWSLDAIVTAAPAAVAACAVVRPVPELPPMMAMRW
jgi:hypothetical protein